MLKFQHETIYGHVITKSKASNEPEIETHCQFQKKWRMFEIPLLPTKDGTLVQLIISHLRTFLDNFLPR